MSPVTTSGSSGGGGSSNNNGSGEAEDPAPSSKELLEPKIIIGVCAMDKKTSSMCVRLCVCAAGCGCVRVCVRI